MSENTNALANASSSYLRSAMHQPIRWHEWGDEALNTAQREDKPILLDIGAVWCHWCHVMDRESYENPAVAAIVNDLFIPVKVDRDERPDIDSRYQAAVQAISGQGGWPLTVFLTPAGRPFFGGTYFPPEDQMGRPGFKRVLQALAQAFRDKRDDVFESAENVMAFITQAESFTGSTAAVSPEIVGHIIASANSMFDAVHGGFSSAPKFPHPPVIDLLIDQYACSGDNDLRTIIVTTLQNMARGGIYDQLAGGFHRYSVDERWVVPHFEKMSYDNSELLKNYVHAFQATGIDFFADVARDIIRWIDSVLSDRDHAGFYASQDADISLDDDGDYFTWTVAEAREILTPAEFSVASLHYDIDETGEMRHNHFKNVLFVKTSPEDISRHLGVDVARVRDLLNSARSKMYAARLRRPTPFVDKTMYVGWNALCISAYLDAARVLSIEDARHFALRSLDRILSQAWHPQRGLTHVSAYSDQTAPPQAIAGILDDYAFTTIACLDAYETTADITYFNFAVRLADAMLERFFDQENGGFLDTPSGHSNAGALAAPRKPFQDSPTPAGNSAAAVALIRLHWWTDEKRYHDAARRTLELFARDAHKYGIFAATFGIAALLLTRPHIQAIVIGKDAAATRLRSEALAPFSLSKAVVCLPDNEAAPQNLPPALRHTVPNIPAVQQGRTAAVICSGFTCQPPVEDPAQLASRLREQLTSSSQRSAAD